MRSTITIRPNLMDRPEVVEKIAALNTDLFGSDDTYSSAEEVEKYEYIVFLDNDETEVLGYLLYSEDDEILEGLRSGVRDDCQGQGISKRLYKKMITKAKRKDKIYYTYTSMNNFASINSHVQCGMRITKFINGWVTMSFEPKKSVSLE